MINLVFGIEGDNMDPVVQELEFSDYDSRSIFVPQQLSAQMLPDFLRLLIRNSSLIRQEETRICAARNSETRLFYLREIRYLEAQGNLVSIAAEEEQFVIYGTLSRIEQAISSFGFIRIHGSFLVSVSHIRSFTARSVFMDDGKQINIGRKYQEGFRRAIQSLKAITLGS